MENKERILEAARGLFFRQGIRNVTMDEIASQTGMSKKTLYAVFPDKDKIVIELMGSYMKSRQEEFRRLAAEAENPIHEIFMIMRRIGEMFGQINPMLFYDLRKNYPEAWKKFGEFKHDCMEEMVEKNLRKGIRLGLYRKEIKVAILSRLRLEQVELVLNPEVFDPSRFNMKEVQIALMEHFMYGIATLEGHKEIDKYRKLIRIR